jgi:hypothetical protein
VSEFKDCPFCRCTFLTQKDLDLHLARFGKDEFTHGRLVKREHERLELFGSDYEIVRGRVVVPFNPNAVLVEFEGIIKDYVRNLEKRKGKF